MTAIAYNDENFRKLFPVFADPAQWPEATLQLYWDTGANFITTTDSPCNILNDGSLQFAHDLMCAHIATLLAVPAQGASGGGGGGSSGIPTSGGVLQSASIGAVSVSMMAPPAKGMWEYWFAQTPYGQQLLALLAILGVGGLYVGGLPERRGYRKVGGVFW
jgi:hypothetical protein